MFKIYKNVKLRGSPVVIVRNCTNKQQISTENCDLDAGYVPSKLEQTTRTRNNDYFKPPVNQDKPPFSLVFPPPNITGTLHLGHALTATVQDVLVRWKRMQGVETVWVPGVDHAGIATQVVVEKALWKEKRQTRHDLGREEFEREVWKWKEEKAGVIAQQLRGLNIAINWEREVFTLDQPRCKAVTTAFIKLFNSGLIYRADHLVNWSCVLQSAISDIEVEHLNVNGPTDVAVPGYDNPVQFGTLTHFAYKVQDSDEEIVVATTRPETMLGDVAVAVHKDDERYVRFVGRRLWHPFRKDTIPIVVDDFVDRTFGTGAVKITPAHDHADFALARRHHLPHLQVINEAGNLTANCGEFAGMRRFDARQVILTELKRLELLRDSRSHEMIVPICSRSKDIVEHLVRPQWFVKCEEMAVRAAEDVREGRLVIQPKYFDKIWFNWMENIRDWCISRQLWWGHRIPAYWCHVHADPNNAMWIAAETAQDAVTKAAKQFTVQVDQISVRQDEDVLDTWFSSALQPFSVFGWPQQSEDLSKYYPLTLMETGHDILFFWTARMLMLGKELTGQLPFNEILLHGIVCDARGKKMSKSQGNVIAPEDIITGTTLQSLEAASKASYAAGVLSEEELKRAVQNQKTMFPKGIPECGSDALRFTLASHNIKNQFINFVWHECYSNKLFCNKIWQATKFTMLWCAKINPEPVAYHQLLPMDQWILSRLGVLVQTINDSLASYDFHLAATAIRNFLYHEFCDIYLETTKRGLRVGNGEIAAGHCWTLLTSLEIALRTLAPFMPVLSQHLHERLPVYPGMEKQYDFPTEVPWGRQEKLEKDVKVALEAIVSIRRLKKIFNVAAKHKPQVHIVSKLPLYADFSHVIQDLTASHNLTTSSTLDNPDQVKGTIKDSSGTAEIYLLVPDELQRTLELDIENLEKKKLKLLKELEGMVRMVSGSGYRINMAIEKQEVHKKKITGLAEKIARINYLSTFSCK